MNDGQGQGGGFNAGIPYAVQTVNAPAGSDADAILALATPIQTTARVTPIDLEFQLPPGVAIASSPGGSGGVPGTTLLLFAAAILYLVVR